MAIQDLHQGGQGAPTGPIVGGFEITPDDSTDLLILTRQIMVTTAGPVKVTFRDDTTLVTPPLQIGFPYSFRVKRVWATDTTATGIVGLY